MAKRYSNKEIAGTLGLGVETVRSYLKNVYGKMQVEFRSETVAKYMGTPDS